MSFKSINPATNEVLESYRETPLRQVYEKIDLAARQFPEWKKFAFPVRAKHLKRTAELLEERKKQYANLITEEMGKPLKQSISEIEKCAWVCNYYADNAKMFLKEEEIKTDAEESYISYEPLGVILAVMPWNFPFWQVFRFAAPALMAGNVGLLKHASNVQKCAMAIEEVLRDAGCHEGVFQNLLIGSSRVKKVIAHEKVAAVTLTGSESAGSKVAEQAGKLIKKTVLELGGSDPFIVLKQANLKEAAKVAVQSRMLNTGQSCIAAKRFIVEECVSGAFLKLMIKEVEKLKVGDPKHKDSDLGPLAREDILKELESQLKQSKRKGAKVEIGGERMKRKGNFFKPTIVSGVKPGMPLYEQEVFGPIAAFIVAENEEECFRIANDNRYGLGAAIWTEEKENFMKLAKNLQAGNVVINSMVKSDPRLPFGGIKKSGYGRELSDYGIKEFVNIKSIRFNG